MRDSRRAQLLEKEESLEEAVSGVAHDFNNVLQVLCAQLELVETHADLPAAAALDVRAALETCERGIELVWRLQSYATGSSRARESVNVTELLVHSRPMLKSVMKGSQRLEMQLPDSAVHALADHSGLDNAVLNLAINARDAMPDDGRLVVSCQVREIEDTSSWLTNAAAGRYVSLRFTDNGSGISEDVLSRLFDPYFTTKGEAGTGLGLSIVWGFVKQSGGHVEVTSTPGAGATFELLLPAAP